MGVACGSSCHFFRANVGVVCSIHVHQSGVGGQRYLFSAQFREAHVGIKNLRGGDLDRVLQHHISISEIGMLVGGVGGRSAKPRA